MPNKSPTTFCEKPLTLRDFKHLPIDSETILLDDESLDIMLGIQETMRTLEPEGLDDIRTLHIETIGRHGTIIWYEVTIRIYKDMHWLCLHSHQGECYSFANKDNLIKKATRHSCKRFLEHLWSYICSVVQTISHDPKSYTRYLEEHVPYQEREGYVKREIVQDLLPDIKIKISQREEVLEMLKRKQNTPPDGYDTMTLRTYIKAWKVAYCAYCQSDSLLSKPAEEVFRRSNQGTALEEYDLDSSADFIRWDKDRNPYHCYDIIYVRIHLYPKHDADTGKWYFDLAFGIESFGNEGMRIAFALNKAGIPFIISYAEEKLAALHGKDTICFSPDYGNRHLTYPDKEDITYENLQKAIAAITWKSFDTINTVVGPRKRVKVTFYPCDDKHYPAPEEESRCIIRNLDEGLYQYWQMHHCPWGWNVLERNEAEYCVLPMTYE